MERICIGVDWEARQVRAAWSASSSGPVYAIEGCEPTMPSVRTFLQRVRTVSGAEDSALLDVIIEAGSMHWVRLFHASGAVVHVVDPKQARRFAESLCSSMAKDDARDAQVLVQLGQSPAHCPGAWAPCAALIAQLDILGQAQRRTQKAQTRAVQQLRQLLRESMPSIEAIVTDISAQWAQSFVQTLPTAWHIAQMSPRKLSNFLSKLSAHSKAKKALKEALAQTQAPWLEPSIAELQALQIRALIKHIALYRQELNDLEERIQKVVSADEDGKRLLQMGGIGPKLAAAILRYQEHDKRDGTAIRMGAAPIFVGSGTTRSGEAKGLVRMRKATQSDARRAVFLIGRLVSKHTPWAMAMYEDGIRRGQRSASIYRRIARSLLRIIHAVLRDKSDYDPHRYLLALQKKGVPWALNVSQ